MTIEVTQDMLDAGHRAAVIHNEYGEDLYIENLGDVFRAMVAASPRYDAKRRQPLTDEQIYEIAQPFGCFEYGDAQGDKRREFVRAIELAHGIA